MESPRLDPVTERLLRDLAPQVLGALMHKFRDFAACEDAVQEALLAAATQWPRDCIPDNPRGWLIRVAAWRMTDHVRSELSRRKREEKAHNQGGQRHSHLLPVNPARLRAASRWSTRSTMSRASGMP